MKPSRLFALAALLLAGCAGSRPAAEHDAPYRTTEALLERLARDGIVLVHRGDTRQVSRCKGNMYRYDEDYVYIYECPNASIATFDVVGSNIHKDAHRMQQYDNLMVVQSGDSLVLWEALVRLKQAAW